MASLNKSSKKQLLSIGAAAAAAVLSVTVPSAFVGCADFNDESLGSEHQDGDSGLACFTGDSPKKVQISQRAHSFSDLQRVGCKDSVKAAPNSPNAFDREFSFKATQEALAKSKRTQVQEKFHVGSSTSDDDSSIYGSQGSLNSLDNVFVDAEPQAAVLVKTPPVPAPRKNKLSGSQTSLASSTSGSPVPAPRAKPRKSNSNHSAPDNDLIIKERAKFESAVADNAQLASVVRGLVKQRFVTDNSDALLLGPNPLPKPPRMTPPPSPVSPLATSTPDFPEVEVAESLESVIPLIDAAEKSPSVKPPTVKAEESATCFTGLLRRMSRTVDFVKSPFRALKTKLTKSNNGEVGLKVHSEKPKSRSLFSRKPKVQKPTAVFYVSTDGNDVSDALSMDLLTDRVSTPSRSSSSIYSKLFGGNKKVSTISSPTNFRHVDGAKLQ